jgi:glycosyltransferase involved in cell wall biosynthesis
VYVRRQSRRPRIIFRIAHDRDCDPKALLIRFWRDRKIYEYGLARTDVILAQTVRQQVAMKANYGRDSMLATMMVEGPRSVRPLEQRDVQVLWVNNIRAFKRPELALELAGLLPQIRLHMIGGTQPGFEEMFEQISVRAAAAQNVAFHGPVPYHDVNDYYERARVFVNTSDTEGFPNSYLQAWARGTPVVAFFDPDGVIAREGLGYVASSLEEMSRIIARLISRPDEWYAVSLRCKEYMTREYAEERILAPYLAAIDARPSSQS